LHLECFSHSKYVSLTDETPGVQKIKCRIKTTVGDMQAAQDIIWASK